VKCGEDVFLDPLPLLRVGSLGNLDNRVGVFDSCFWNSTCCKRFDKNPRVGHSRGVGVEKIQEPVMIRTSGWQLGVAAALIGWGCGSKSEPAAAKVESAAPAATAAPVTTAVATPKPTTTATVAEPVAPPPVVKKSNEPTPEGVFLPAEEEATEIAFPSLPGADGKTTR
jgi:hypothetical protein